VATLRLKLNLDLELERQGAENKFPGAVVVEAVVLAGYLEHATQHWTT